MSTRTAKERFRERAIAALLTCRTIAEAAEQAGVCERTLLRWKKEPEFQAAFAAAKGELLEIAVNKLRIAAPDAGDRLHRTVTGEIPPHPAAVAAAGKIYDLLFMGITATEISERLAKIERAQKEDQS